MSHHHYKVILISTILLVFTACTVGPDYVRPATDVPPSYKESEGWKKAQPRDGVAKGPWWEIFNDPLLNELEERVGVSNQNVAVAEAQYHQARALVQAVRAGYFPKITAGASVTRSRGSSHVGSGSFTSAGTTNDFLLPVDFSWELDIWGKVRRSVEASQASAEASAANLEAVRLSMQAELAVDYFALRSLDAQKELLDATAAAYEKSLQLTKNRYNSGIASRGDVLLAETQVNTTQAQAIDTSVQRAQLEHAIALLVGTAASVFSLKIAPLTALPPAIPVGVPSELLERRPDIASSERSVAAANAQIGVAMAAYYPTVTLSASGGFESSQFSKWLTWPSRFWSVGPSVLETVVEGGLRRAQTEEARAAYDASVASYRQTVLTAFQEVEDNLAALRILEDEARVQDEAVKAATQALAVTTNQYKAGTVSYIDVIVTQALALNNERTLITIQGRRMVAAALLIKALGGGWNEAEFLTTANVKDEDRSADQADRTVSEGPHSPH
ncbi:MAG TPA: efflux transporter outer membrane subunit [Thermodesulfovibrionales bacterium]|nr:efflux transporter outer membrane subunit [Thermodesulfovibrionales bacterium]